MAKAQPKKKPKQVKPRPFPLQGFVLLIIGVLVIALIVLKSSLWKAYPVEGGAQLISINSGDSYSALIDRWTKEDKAKFPLLLKLYQRFAINDSLKAGVYEVQDGMSIAEVLRMLANAENAQMNRILVIEGTTFKQLIERLKHDKLVTQEVSHLPTAELLKALNIPFDHPEGLFAPDTYFFAKGETDRKILTDLYQRQMKALDAAWENRATDLPYQNKYQALIMASIVERETSVDAELSKVSGVFVRRLKIGMRLQTDPTVIYGMGDAYKGNITRKDLRTPTPYNTYTISGLPPTPIALPSKKAIEAAMHPDDSEYLYFVATGTGGHQFSRTYEEHKKAIVAYHKAIGVIKE